MSEQNTGEKFRRWGYLQASVDPLGQMEPFPHRELDEVPADEAKPWRDIYCGSIAAEFMHIPFPERCEWVASKMESPEPPILDGDTILKRILSAETFERYIHTRYVGAKRFSLEGIAVLIPLLDSIINEASEHGFTAAMIGMSHRGRLNTMYHIAGSVAANVFADFEDIDPKSVLGAGDVKYHKGATGNYQTQSGKDFRIHLASNPSHLEAINPVITGRVRARQQRLGDDKREKVLAILLHGDAAFAGQGIAAETLNFAGLEGFEIGGTVHVIVNNLIGFTAKPAALHSSRFASDIAKRLPIPIFHVNAEKPNDVVRVGQLATDYRATFSSDVVIDLMGFRRYGHSEIDDPTLTSPVLYDKIKNWPLLHQSYAEHIGKSEEEVKQLEDEVMAHLKEQQEQGRAMTTQPKYAQMPEYWEPYFGGLHEESFEIDTAVPIERLQEIGQLITETPADFEMHPKLQKGFEQRKDMVLGNRPLDWGMAENLAYASLLWEGTPVRITGQDSRRGTFSHRQAVLYDYKTGEEYIPMANLHADQGFFEVFNSMLSEAAALGFEYGFSRDYPEALVCWEAQFGDFVNGAQIIIDQFIAAAEDKWNLLSGVVMLLPHGYEGQGPEHSSARLERFLQLAAEDNIQVAQPSTAAQNFHLLRRQALRKWRKPLVVFTPKSMLRAPAAASSLEDLSSQRFQTAIDSDDNPLDAKRLLFCSGKIVHELRAACKEHPDVPTAVVSIEQLYPFPEKVVSEIIRKYADAKTVIWVQEEPANMGSLFFVRPILERLAYDRSVTTVRRSASASPATGSPKAHAMEQQALIRLAFASYN